MKKYLVSGILVRLHITVDQNASSYSYDLKCTGEEMEKQNFTFM